MFTWPENAIPLPSANFAAQNESSVLRSQMETGRFRQRRRFTVEHESASLSWDLVDSEYAVFKAIWNHKLKSGTDWFTMRLPVGLNELLTLVEVRFVSNYTASHSTFGNWAIGAPIEFREAQTISEEDLDLIIDPPPGPPTEPVPVNALTYGGENIYFNDNYLTFN